MSSQGAPDTKPAPDWERIEADYRAGILSLREIVAPFKLTEGALRKRAKRDNWSRDLGAKIKARAEELVRKDAVRTEGTQSGLSTATEKQVVEANAEIVANVDRRHKDQARKAQELVTQLFQEVAVTTDNLDLFEQLGEILDKTETTERGKVIEDKLNKIYRGVISMEGRVDSLKKLAETFERLAKFERVAYRLEDGPPPQDPDQPITPERQIEGVRRLAFLLTQAARQQPEPAHG